MSRLFLAAGAALLTGCLDIHSSGAGEVQGGLVLHAEIPSASAGTTGHIAVHAPTATLALLDTRNGRVLFFDLETPAAPSATTELDLEIAAGEEATSLAFHPTRALLLVTVRTPSGGRLEVWDLAEEARVQSVPTGDTPTRVGVDPRGEWAVVLNAARTFHFDEETRVFTSAPAGMTLLRLDSAPSSVDLEQVDFPEITGEPGFVGAEDGRWLEVGVDWNGNGKIDPTLDFDGDGVIEDVEVLVGTFQDQNIYARESDGESFRFPLHHNTPELLRPSDLAFSRDGALVYVSLRENNGVLVFNLPARAFVRAFGLGQTTHMTDIHADGEVLFDTLLTALREPASIALTTDDRAFLTADAGGSFPGARDTPRGLPAGGGRGFALFDALTGKLLDDTESELERRASTVHLYRDELAPTRGTAPEDLAAFALAGVTVAVATLPDLDAVCLLAVQEGRTLEILQIVSVRASGDAKRTPRGIAHYALPRSSRHYLYVANEASNTISVFEARLEG